MSTVMETDSNLYKLVYCSRNRIKETNAQISEELQKILVGARKRNAGLGITGALLYNAGSFAQALEGPLESIEVVFEAIQRDSRHSEVVVVQSGPVAGREFPGWSMAMASRESDEDAPLLTAAFDAVFANTLGAGEQMISTLKRLIATEDDSIRLQAE